ncbi:MAG TPA: PAS domain-containing protein, partial [Solirubrobacteraceae bacterium]|nr:PAS domain-containing protein [Solirubrobacteraceae bacterium]
MESLIARPGRLAQRIERRFAEGPDDSPEICLRLESIPVAFWLTILVSLGTLDYAALTWSRPYRARMCVVAGFALGSLGLLWLMPVRRIVRSRWREAFFVGWSVLDVVMLAILAQADSPMGPFAVFFVLPLVFASVSYPRTAVLLVALADVLGYLAVALADGHGISPEEALVALGLGCAGLMCVLHARNTKRQRLETEAVTAALRLSEESHRERAEQMSEAQQIAHLGSWEWDVQADRVAWSQELYRIYGLTVQDMAPTFAGYLSCVHPDDRERVSRTVASALEAGEVFRFQERIVRPDGEVRTLESQGRVVS